MEMPWRLCIEKRQEEAKAVVEAVFRDIESTFSLYNQDSEISKINRSPLRRPLFLSAPLAHLLALSLDIQALTQGRFDPTCGKIKRVWKEALESRRLPSPALIEDLKSCSGSDKITLKDQQLIKRAAVELDLDGIAKGYAIDQVIERLLDHGHTNCFFEWSGDMRAAGRHPSGRLWQVALPGTNELVALRDCAIAGSGDYLQNWRGSGIEKEELFTHFASPRLGALNKVGRLAGVSVMAKSCALADAMATSAMLTESEEAFHHWTQLMRAKVPGLAFWPLVRGETWGGK